MSGKERESHCTCYIKSPCRDCLEGQVEGLLSAVDHWRDQSTDACDRLINIQKVVNEQADDEGLWGLPLEL